MEDLQVFFSDKTQPIIDKAASIKCKKVKVLNVCVDVESVPFNKGFYSVDMTYYFLITLDVYAAAVSPPVTVQGVAVYRFDREPQNFLLSLIATEVYEDTLGDVIYGIEYSNDYMLAILPLYSRKDREAIYYKCYYLSGNHWI